jgi:acyl-CoA dehydrogenase
VPSAIAKYHCTNAGRDIAKDIMDVIGGKGIVLGPRNFAGRSWQASPIAITVEGANIMTRSLLIFGQGSILCHPYILKEMRAAQDPDRNAGLNALDATLYAHIGSAISNTVRSFWFGATGAMLGRATGDAYTKKFFRKLNRYAANLALLTDVSLGALGGRLKFKESLSGRLGDVLSHLYMMSAVLKRHHDEGCPEADKPLLAWAFHNSAYEIELALSQALRNFPIKPLGWLLWPVVFPWGRRAVAPGDRLSHRVSSLLMNPNEARERLAGGVFLTPGENNPGGRINSYLEKAIAAEPVERKFLKALKTKDIEALDFAAQLDEGVHEGWITAEERKQLEELRTFTMDTISVDDFDPHELRAASYYDTKAGTH